MMNLRDRSVLELKEALLDESTVLFIGSGVSAWSKLPTWNQLLLDLSKLVELKGHSAEAILQNKDSQPLMAASYGTRYLNDDEFAAFIKRACGSATAKPHKIHRLLTKLGPTCYVTTNYDHLLEQALQKYDKKKVYKKVLNNQPIDCSSILPVREKQYVFKLHGDMDYPETVVLNNEQYEAQYASGSRIYASRTLENILLTRTVVFIGYSLKDPDFQQVIAKIRNEFRSFSCTHFALVPECSPEEKAYWEEQYNIKLISYEARIEGGGYDYGKLITALESLSDQPKVKASEQSLKRLTQKQKRALNRYINALAYSTDLDLQTMFPLNIEVKKYSNRRIYRVQNQLLTELPQEDFLLTGVPGAGKSHLLRRYCKELAIGYHEMLSSSARSKEKPKIPVLVNLKLYEGRGSLYDQIAKQFPDDIPVEQWLSEGRFAILCDAYNEITETYRENKLCLHEINHYRFRGNRIIVSSRNNDGLDSFYFPTLEILSIDANYVADYLTENNIFIDEKKSYVLLSLLEKPLFFRLMKQNKISVNSNSTPRSLYDSYFEFLNQSFIEKYAMEIDFKALLLPLAYKLILSGSEGFAVEELIALLDDTKSVQNKPFATMHVINWLIEEQQFLTPLRSNLISFFHQSFTEFLAGNHLAKIYLGNSDVLLEHLRHTRLDYVLMYATEFLPAEQARQYLRTILDHDMILSARACSYLEEDSETTLQFVLEYIEQHIFSEDFGYWVDFEFHTENLPVTPYHEAILRKLMLNKDVVGGHAAKLLIKVLGPSIVDEMLEEMFKNIERYNYLSSIAQALSPHITPDTFQRVMEQIRSFTPPKAFNEDMDISFSRFSHLADHLSIEDILYCISTFGGYDKLTSWQKEVVLGIASHNDSQKALDFAILQFTTGEFDYAFSIYLKLKYHGASFDLQGLDAKLLIAVIVALKSDNVEAAGKKWIIGLLHAAYQQSPGFAKLVRSILKHTEDLVRLAVLYAIGKNRAKSFFRHFSSMLYWDHLPNEIIGAFHDIDWSKSDGYTDRILGTLIDKYPLYSLTCFLKNLENWRFCEPSFDVFLKLMIFVQHNMQGYFYFDDFDEVGVFLSEHVYKDTLLNFYRVTVPKIKQFMNYCVFNKIDWLEMEDFSKSDINTLMKELSTIDYEALDPNAYLLSNIATPLFIEQRLLPLIADRDDLMQKNLQQLFRKIEQDHGRRYLVEHT